MLLYHGGDWHIVTRLAIRLTEQARSERTPFDDTASYVLKHPDAQHLSGWEKEALYSLLIDTIRPYAPWPRRPASQTARPMSLPVRSSVRAFIRQACRTLVGWPKN